MSFISRLFGSRGGAADRAQDTRRGPDSVQASRLPPANHAMRRELLRVTLRDTLRRCGIPLGWIGAEVLSGSSREGHVGLHWQLSVRHWDPRLVMRMVALQNNLVSRLLAVDPMASQWLLGLSWQFALADESACPPLPHPGSWTSLEDTPMAQAAGAHPGGGSADVIAGPVRIEDTGSAAHAELEQRLAARDADFLARPGGGGEATEPMYLSTQPARLR
ncbi:MULTISPECIES: hypothetical protein [Ramlibacter]|uniref:DUF721 domain-containing protein n=1 Tax=Ramlibacter aquaticus TaxID=2780094 RepID=A0ABR9SHN8_9BURK|nr:MULTISPECIES: hypothetical protein [Ramlibacter]MBE7941881.1 hypothetical protein [Ramlibacter aquaticus]